MTGPQNQSRAKRHEARAAAAISFVLWKSLSEHGSAAFRLLCRGLILNDVPMLDEDSVLNAHNICGNPIHRSTETAKSSVHNHEVPLSHDRSRLVLQCRRNALDEVEQPFTAGRDMSAVLNVIGRPVALDRYVVPFIEENVKSLKNDCLVFFLFSLAH